MTDQPTPSRRAGLRDELAKAIHRYDRDHLLSRIDIPSEHHRGEADAVLAVLYRDWPWLRAEAEEAAPVSGPAATQATEADDPEEPFCGVEPPMRADDPNSQWGDCWCTLPPGHDGEHRCQPCTDRHGAPGWQDDPDDTDQTEADIDHAMTTGTPVQIVTPPNLAQRCYCGQPATAATIGTPDAHVHVGPVLAPSLIRIEAEQFHESDEDPGVVKAAFDTGEKGVTAPAGLPDTVTDPAWLRDLYAAAIRAIWSKWIADWANTDIPDPEGDLADAVLRVRDRHLDQLRQRLALADAELAQWAAAESADAAAGSYAGRAETAERQRDQYAATLRQVLDAFEAYWTRASYCGPGGTAVQPEHFRGWRAVLNPQEQS